MPTMCGNRADIAITVEVKVVILKAHFWGKSSESFAKQRAECTNNFKSAHQEGKTMWGVFEETGWFVSACRHSLVMWFSDMIWTGEQ